MDNNTQSPKPMVTFYESKDPEKKEYLILIVGTDKENDSEFKDFRFVTGRTAAYEFIKGLVISETIDMVESKIIVEGQPIEKRKTAIEFMKYVLDGGLIEDPGFDIEDYFVGDYIKEQEEE
jgi:hypothetical protein